MHFLCKELIHDCLVLHKKAVLKTALCVVVRYLTFSLWKIECGLMIQSVHSCLKCKDQVCLQAMKRLPQLDLNWDVKSCENKEVEPCFHMLLELQLIRLQMQKLHVLKLLP